MLVLTRYPHRPNENAITITAPRACEIHIVVISEREGKVRIGLEAPFDVKIWRDELLDHAEAREPGA